MRYRHISIIPSYLMIIVVMVIIGVIASSIVAHVFLPLGKQKGYLKTEIDYVANIDRDKVIIQVINRKTYDTKIDIVLVTKDNRILTACPSGYIRSSSITIREGGFSLLGLEIKGQEILTIVCFIDNIKDVRIYGYGVPGTDKKEIAYVGSLPAIYLAGKGYDISRAWKSSIFSFRMPVTVITTKTYSPAYIAVKLSLQTLPSNIWNFFRKHIRSDLNDILITGVNGKEYPTKAVRGRDGSIIVYFKVDKLEPGIHRFYLYFGNPYLWEPLYLLKDNIDSRKLISTPSRLPHTIRDSIVYPAYMIPEANWLPRSDELRFGLIYTRHEDKLDEYVSIIRYGDIGQVRQIISKALSNKVYFPVGTFGARRWWGYWNLYPKTDMKWAPWGIVTVIPLPRINNIPNPIDVKVKLWVSSDDGSGAYIVVLGHDKVYRRNIYWNLYAPHPPGYWRYSSKTITLSRDIIEDSDMYLIIFVQNGICRWRYCGNGPGYLDFRLILWYIEKSGRVLLPTEQPPIYSDYYVDVTVYGIGNDLYDYAFPVDLTGRSDIDWTVFKPNTVYVVSSDGEPLYYWVQSEGRKTIVWVKIPHIPARGEYRFRIYYGGDNKYPEYNKPEKVFSFFDDFSTDPTRSGKWNIYLSRTGIYRWDRAGKVFYLIYNKYWAGIAMFMKNINWKKNFHVHFKAYISRYEDGLTFFFFKDEGPYKRYRKPDTAYTLALSARRVKSRGYAIEFDMEVDGSRDPPVPHVALVETYTYYDVSENPHYGYKRYWFKNKWMNVDIYYYNGVVEVKIDGKTIIKYRGNLFSRYGIRYGGMGFSASTADRPGIFGIDIVFLRYYPGREPTAKIVGYKP